METAEPITETEMLFGIDMTNSNADYAKALPGSLRRTEDGFYHAEFSVEPMRKYLRGGKRIFWLGGRLADGHPFAANIIADT